MRVQVRRGGMERGRQTGSHAGSAGSESSMGLELRNPEIRTWAKARVRGITEWATQVPYDKLIFKIICPYLLLITILKPSADHTILRTKTGNYDHTVTILRTGNYVDFHFPLFFDSFKKSQNLGTNGFD